MGGERRWVLKHSAVSRKLGPVLQNFLKSSVAKKRPRIAAGPDPLLRLAADYSRLPVSDRMNWNMLTKFR